jgi:nucleoside-diphosphate-sugar epimerase
VIFNPARNWDHSGRRFGSTEKSRKELAFNTEVELRDGLKNTIAWTQKNIALIDTCIQKHKENLIRCQ